MRSPLDQATQEPTTAAPTPGLWRARSTGRDLVIEADDPAGVGAAPFQIAVITCGDFTDATGIAKRINTANATLIAAAPKMLDALKVTVSALRASGFYIEAIEQGDAAIAAAVETITSCSVSAGQAATDPAMPSVDAPTTAWFTYYRQEIAFQARELTRLQRIEAAALRVASSRRNRVVTDQGPLDALDQALEAWI